MRTVMVSKYYIIFFKIRRISYLYICLVTKNQKSNNTNKTNVSSSTTKPDIIESNTTTFKKLPDNDNNTKDLISNDETTITTDATTAIQDEIDEEEDNKSFKNVDDRKLYATSQFVQLFNMGKMKYLHTRVNFSV